jgi:penicillin-binding protein 1A
MNVIIRRPLAVLAACVLVATLCGVGLGYFHRFEMPDLHTLQDYAPPVISTLMADDGRVIASFAAQRRILIDRQGIPQHFIEALLSTEDANFYNHPGVDLRGIARAVLKDLRELELSQGASTLTMQLARTTFLTHDKTFKRKLLEVMIALEIERSYSKDEILTFYCNQVYMGHGRYGLEAASRYYLGKPARSLTLAEATLLVGLIQRPESLSPRRHPDRSLKRREHVLKRMVDRHYITTRQAEVAGREPLMLAVTAEPVSHAPYFVEEVRRLLKTEYGDAGIYKDGLQVRTTLNPRLQRMANDAVDAGLRQLDKRQGWRGEDSEQPPLLQAALVALDPSTGAVLALVGGFNFAESEWNRATQARRQPGSAFKPFVFAAALANGWTLADRIQDEPTVFLDPDTASPYQPENYSKTYYGNLTLRKAVEKSVNISTVKLLNDVGYDATIDLAQRLGIRSTLRPYPSLALGAFETSLLDLTAAYATFANQGVRAEPHLVVEIRDQRGDLLSRTEPQVADVLSPQLAYLINQCLAGVVSDGTGRAAASLSHPLAGKTGTTDDNTDAWFIGYTPDLAVGVWVGFDDNRSIGSRETGAQAALPIWKQFMEAALDGQPVTHFEEPPGVVFVAIDRLTGLRAVPGSGCETVYREVFIAGTEPTRYCSETDHALLQAPYAVQRYALGHGGELRIPDEELDILLAHDPSLRVRKRGKELVVDRADMLLRLPFVTIDNDRASVLPERIQDRLGDSAWVGHDGRPARIVLLNRASGSE